MGRSLPALTNHSSFGLTLMNPTNLRLFAHLHQAAPGRISGRALQKLTPILSQAWPHLKGSDQGGTSSLDLVGRMKEVTWDGAYLFFKIEGYGRTKSTSTHAELDSWKVFPAGQTAILETKGGPQRTPVAKLVRTESLVQKFLPSILHRKDHPALHWRNKLRTEASLALNKVVPKGAIRQTTAGRNRRFLQALAKALGTSDWEVTAGALRLKANR